MRRDPAPVLRSGPADPEPVAERGAPGESVASLAEKEADRSEAYRYLGRLGSRDALWESEDGLVLLDCRSAWERVTFERLKKQAEAHSTFS